jgi:glyoxylase-like metal-dependent hydrolase (beta-lactamase superfamily II)
MFLKQLTVGPIREHPYLLIDEKEKKAVLIDAGGGVEEIVEELAENQAKLIFILFTHAHPDHIAFSGLLKEKTGAKVGFHQEDIAQYKKDWSLIINQYLPGLKLNLAEPDFYVEDGQLIEVGEIELKVIHTPGHSEGSVCYFEPDRKWLFSGDTLFAQGRLGRTDLEGSDPQKMSTSVAKLLRLPPETKIYPGHGLESTIKEEIFYHK